MSDAKEGPSEHVSEDLRKFVDQLDLLDHIRDCVLFHPEFDFTNACSCDQCRPEIARLMKFEKDIQAKRRLIQKYNSETNDKEELCSGISDCADLTKQLFDLLQKKLKAVYEELEIPWEVDNSSSAANLGIVDEKIFQTLIDRGLSGEPDEKDPNVHYPNDSNVLNKIRIGYYRYGKTKAKDKAYPIMKDIEKLEKDHQMEEKMAKAQKTSLNPAISKKYLEKQIELVKKLPVNDLLHEVNELIGDIRSRDFHLKMYEEARELISKTCFAIIQKRKKFWQGAPSLSTEGIGHNSNGLNETLKSLIAEVDSFEHQWENCYAKFLAPYDRSNPKRLATG
ncbi:hypothetical protein CASFOL_003347 [Castilleja foliolosa]|uniref:Uncharacterized protein n=1 Tax=Castilleja foliolosa TaxID=1961234 RepID=A0ABD3EK96_9LAMI